MTTRAQDVHLLTGSMTVQPGTSLRLQGPLNWIIEPGAVVINDGVIDLGEQGVLSEPVGSPITGSGTELARTPTTSPAVPAEPGGLGLLMTPSAAVGPVDLERWHQPLSLPGGDMSISRWYRIIATETPGTSMEFELHYDATELNGLDPNALGLFEGEAVNGPWTGLSSLSTPSESTVVATDQSPWSLITAFDADAPTYSESLVALESFQAWPTLVDDHMNVVCMSNEMLTRIDVIDGLGRVIQSMPMTSASAFTILDLGHLAAGSYLLRVNHVHVIKFRKA